MLVNKMLLRTFIEKERRRNTLFIRCAVYVLYTHLKPKQRNVTSTRVARERKKREKKETKKYIQRKNCRQDGQDEQQAAETVQRERSGRRVKNNLAQT